MGDINISIAGFVVMCVTIFILVIVVMFLTFILYRMKSKEYKRLFEQGESNVTTINSNRYNIMFHNNKESEDLLVNMGTKLNFDEPGLVTKSCKNSIHKVETDHEAQDQTDNTSVKKHEQNPTTIPTLMAQQQIARICTEIMRSKNSDHFRESHELKDLSNYKMKLVRTSALDRSKSTPELDIYDVVPQRIAPINYNGMEEEVEYSSPMSDSKVVLDFESGYYLPLSLKTKTYANAANVE